MKMDRDLIVAAAAGLLNDSGLEAFSMRAVAKRLDVDVATLYYYVRDKDQLISLTAYKFYRTAYDAVGPQQSWRHWLLAYGFALNETLAGTQGSARVCTLARPVDADLVPPDWMAQELGRMGLPRDRALTFMGSVISLTLGWASFRENSAMNTLLRTMFDIDKSYDEGLRAMVAGFTA